MFREMKQLLLQTGVSELRYTYHPLLFHSIVSFSTVGIYKNRLVCDLRLWSRTQLVKQREAQLLNSKYHRYFLCTQNMGMHISWNAGKGCKLNLHLFKLEGRSSYLPNGEYQAMNKSWRRAVYSNCTNPCTCISNSNTFN